MKRINLLLLHVWWCNKSFCITLSFKNSFIENLITPEPDALQKPSYYPRIRNMKPE